MIIPGKVDGFCGCSEFNDFFQSRWLLTLFDRGLGRIKDGGNHIDDGMVDC